MEHCGIDVHVKSSQVTVVDDEGEVLERATLPTTRTAVERWFGGRPAMRILLEASGSSPWVSRVLKGCGHRVGVVDPRRVRMVAESTLKTDRIDADTLAELARLRMRLRTLVWQRSEESQLQRGHLRVRRALVEARARFIVTIRGLLRSFGVRVASCRADRFAARCEATTMRPELADIVAPLLAAIRDLDERIAAMDTVVEQVGQGHFAVASFQEIPGVGPVVALGYVLSIEDPSRFRRSRDVPGYLGLRPRLRASGELVRRGRITKEGDPDLRRLLVQAAHGHLRSRTDTARKRWAEGLVPRIGKRKAIVALARKLAVLMHRLWLTGEVYEPFPEEVAKAAWQRINRTRTQHREEMGSIMLTIVLRATPWAAAEAWPPASAFRRSDWERPLHLATHLAPAGATARTSAYRRVMRRVVDFTSSPEHDSARRNNLQPNPS